MPFWSDPKVEPKRKNRWLLYIQHFEPFMVSTFTKPSISISKSTYQELNNIRYKPNIAKWEPCNFTITDLEVGFDKNTAGYLNTTAGFMAILKASGYPILEEPNLPKRDKNDIVEVFGTEDPTDYYEKGGEIFSNILKEKATYALGIVRFEQLSAGKAQNNKMEVIEEWVLHNCWIERCDFGGEMSYEDDIVKISATICYDYATYIRRK